MSLFSAQGSLLIKGTLVNSLQSHCTALFLSKQVWTIPTGRLNSGQTLEVSGTYTLLGKLRRWKLVLQAHYLGLRGFMHAWCFLGKCASYTTGDLIQRKELGSW